ncbi:hypothetical protein BDY21DRAFT_377110 [Lineolata rhizophorae]|uniref:Kinetochore protein Sos7 coiled-coil domain-containing protein n=1 Tax=Lineolata rhizophorae TaxID=578093 RepID=A0A6A6P8V0_9PEZI|nr:hypothetical protein BDY21DRAFT_377110 [Lineolata rhizophorae]
MATTTEELSDVLAQLQKPPDLEILQLNASLATEGDQNAEKRTSDVSDASANMENASLGDIEASLIYNKDLFSKLRFTYVEQNTKEKFLRAIIGDPPTFVEQQENAEFEAQLLEVKAALKEKKQNTAELVADLERRARALTHRYESVLARSAQLAALPDALASLESTIADLRARTTPPSSNPSLVLPLPETQSLVASREAELAQLDHELSTFQNSVPRKARELERLEAELRPLETHKTGAVAAAKEARRRKEESERGGMGDELEERGRWLRGVEAGLRQLLEVEQ